MRGITDEDVELPELVHTPIDGVAAELLARQVAFDDDTAAAERFDRAARLVGIAFLRGQGRDRHIRALAREHHRDGAADT